MKKIAKTYTKTWNADKGVWDVKHGDTCVVATFLNRSDADMFLASFDAVSVCKKFVRGWHAADDEGVDLEEHCGDDVYRLAKRAIKKAIVKG